MKFVQTVLSQSTMYNMEDQILNIIVSGTGGQGVFTLSNFIRRLSIAKGFLCEGATFKGGAQRMGSIYSELRILTVANQTKIFSSQIPKGKVDLLIALEPWEALRFSDQCNANTKLVANTQEQKLYVERMASQKNIDPIQTLENLFQNRILKNYTLIAEKDQTSNGHINNLMLHDAIENEFLPFNLEDLNQLTLNQKL